MWARSMAAYRFSDMAVHAPEDTGPSEAREREWRALTNGAIRYAAATARDARPGQAVRDSGGE